jgi:hypothetical protein
MALVGVTPPKLPVPSGEIDTNYLTDLVRALELRGTKITLTDLPTSATDLEVGALFNDSGTVKVVT